MKKNKIIFFAFSIFLFLGFQKVQALSSIATISSSVYTITDDGAGNGSIANVPDGIAVSEFLSNITKDDPNEVFDTSYLEDSNNSGHVLLGTSALTVTSEDGLSSIFYMLNAGPISIDTAITGTPTVGQTLSGSYTYSDIEGDTEGVSLFQWYRGGNNNISAIAGATNSTYTVSSLDEGKILYFAVTPVATTGTPIKKEYKSGGVLIDSGPTATSVAITGQPSLGQTLTGSYVYSDENLTWTDVGLPHFSDGQAIYTSFAFGPDGVPYVAYKDASISPYEGRVKKFNGTSWVNVGGVYSSGGSINAYTYIAIDANNTPYVSYGDESLGTKVAVKKFDGSSWVTVGTSEFSDGSILYYAPIVFDTNNTPYVAYKDQSLGGKIVVKKFNGTSWTTVGTPAFSDGSVLGISIKISTDNTPYVSYSDLSHDGDIQVKKFNGTAWIDVDSDSLVGYRTGSNKSLILDGAGSVYLAVVDSNDRATVRKFNGTSWATVGTPSFSDGVPNHFMIEFDSQGALYVGYEDYPNTRQGADFLTESRLTVKKFNGIDWENIGAPSVSSAGSDVIFFALNPSTDVPYFGYDGGYALGNPNNWKATVKKLISSTDVEGGSLVKWYRDGVPIAGAESSTYTITADDLGKTLTFEVTPVSLTGTTNGVAVQSSGVLIPAPSSSGGGGGSGYYTTGCFYTNDPVATEACLPSIHPVVPSSDCPPGVRYSPSTGKPCPIIELQAGPSAPVSIISRTLKLGIRGADVLILQKYLNSHGFPVSFSGAGSSGFESTYFGPSTKRALVKFQKANKLIADGILGSKTRAVINKNIVSK